MRKMRMRCLSLYAAEPLSQNPLLGVEAELSEGTLLRSFLTNALESLHLWAAGGHRGADERRPHLCSPLMGKNRAEVSFWTGPLLCVWLGACPSPLLPHLGNGTKRNICYLRNNSKP